MDWGKECDRIAKLAVKLTLQKYNIKKGKSNLSFRYLKRRNLPEDKMKKIRQIYDNHCAQCAKIMNLEVHHLRPVCYGGTDSIDNLILLCKDCHQKIHHEESILWGLICHRETNISPQCLPQIVQSKSGVYSDKSIPNYPKNKRRPKKE